MAGGTPPPPLQLELALPPALTLDVPSDALSPLDVGGPSGGDLSHGSSGLGGGGGSSNDARASKTLSISKSGTIQIDGFEIRQSGLLATPMKGNSNGSTGGGGSGTGSRSAGKLGGGGGRHLGLAGDHGAARGAAAADDAAALGLAAEDGPVLSSQLADGGLLLSLQDALAPLTVLGRGAGGTVWQALHVPSLRVVAVKTIPVFEEGRRHQMVRELRALYANLAPLASPTTLDQGDAGGLGGTGAGGGAGDGDGADALEQSAAGPGDGGCPQLVSFYDAYVSPTEGTVSIVQEYMDGGSLQEMVEGGGCAHEAILAHVAHQVLQGLAFLHERRQIHRDIKPANLLINHKGQVKISDFGLVRHLDSSVSRADTFVGTFTYMSPERICGEEYSYSADVWGLGLTLVTCALGRFPYEHTGGYWELVNALRELDPPELPASQFSPAFRDLVRLCLAKDPAQRPSARRLVGHAFVRPAAAAAPRIPLLVRQEDRALQQQRHHQEDDDDDHEGGRNRGNSNSGGSSSSSGSSARAELDDIVRAVQAHYRRRWAVLGAGEGGGGSGGGGGEGLASSCGNDDTPTELLLLLSLDEGGLGAVPNTSAKALRGLARQLGLPFAVVRGAFQAMLRELTAELEKAATGQGQSGGRSGGGE